MDPQPQRRSCRQRAVNGHAVPGHDQPGTFRPHQPQPPGHIAGQQQTFAKAQQQTPHHQQREFSGGGQRQLGGEQIGRADQRDRQHALLGGDFRAVPVSAPAGEAARQQRGEKLHAYRHAHHQVAVAQLLMHKQRDHRQRQPGGQIG